MAAPLQVLRAALEQVIVKANRNKGDLVYRKTVSERVAAAAERAFEAIENDPFVFDLIDPLVDPPAPGKVLMQKGTRDALMVLSTLLASAELLARFTQTNTNVKAAPNNATRKQTCARNQFTQGYCEFQALYSQAFQDLRELSTATDAVLADADGVEKQAAIQTYARAMAVRLAQANGSNVANKAVRKTLRDDRLRAGLAALLFMKHYEQANRSWERRAAWKNASSSSSDYPLPRNTLAGVFNAVLAEAEAVSGAGGGFNIHANLKNPAKLQTARTQFLRKVDPIERQATNDNSVLTKIDQLLRFGDGRRDGRSLLHKLARSGLERMLKHLTTGDTKRLRKDTTNGYPYGQFYARQAILNSPVVLPRRKLFVRVEGQPPQNYVLTASAKGTPRVVTNANLNRNVVHNLKEKIKYQVAATRRGGRPGTNAFKIENDAINAAFNRELQRLLAGPARSYAYAAVAGDSTLFATQPGAIQPKVTITVGEVNGAT